MKFLRPPRPRFMEFLEGLARIAPIRIWALCGAAPIVSGLHAWNTWIVAYDAWPADLAGKRLDILGQRGLGEDLIIAIIVVSFALVKVSARGPGGTSFEVDAHVETLPPAPLPQPMVETTNITKITPAQAATP